jgi:DNA repair protein RadC
MEMKKVFMGEAVVSYVKPPEQRIETIQASSDAVKFFRELMGDEVNLREHFCVMYLNQANRIMWAETHSIGSQTSCIVDVPGILRKAIVGGCKSLILSHNHPSGNTSPSEADRQMTKKLKEGSKYFDISVLDHLILTDGDYYSFADHGERSLN